MCDAGEGRKYASVCSEIGIVVPDNDGVIIVRYVFFHNRKHTHALTAHCPVESGFHVGGAIPVTLHCRVAATQAYGLQDMQI